MKLMPLSVFINVIYQERFCMHKCSRFRILQIKKRDLPPRFFHIQGFTSTRSILNLVTAVRECGSPAGMTMLSPAFTV